MAKPNILDLCETLLRWITLDNPYSVIQNRVIGVVAEEYLQKKKLEDDIEEVEQFDRHVSQKEEIAKSPTDGGSKSPDPEKWLMNESLDVIWQWSHG